MCVFWPVEVTSLSTHVAAFKEHQFVWTCHEDQGKVWNILLCSQSLLDIGDLKPRSTFIGEMSHLQVQMTSWSVPSELHFGAVLPWPTFLGLAGFIHHTRQVYIPRPEAKTANKLPWHIDCLPYLTLEASRVLFPIATNTSNYHTGLSGTIFLVFHSAHCDLGCLNDASLSCCSIPLRCAYRCLCSYRICFISAQT